MYLVRKKNAKTAHLWTGFDTVCRMYSTGGLRKKAYHAVHDSVLPLCAMCETNNAKKIIPADELPPPKKSYPRKVARFSDSAVQAAVDALRGQS